MRIIGTVILILAVVGLQALIESEKGSPVYYFGLYSVAIFFAYCSVVINILLRRIEKIENMIKENK